MRTIHPTYGELIPLLATLLVGCAQMSVKVAIFDQKYFPYGAELTEAVKAAAADVSRFEAGNAYNNWRAGLKTSVYEAVEASPALRPLIDKPIPNPLDQWIGRVEAMVDRQVHGARERHLAGLSKWDEARRTQDRSKFEQLVRGAFADFAEGNKILEQLPKKLRAELAEDTSTKAALDTLRAPKPDVTKSQLVDAGAKASVRATRGLIADQGIQTDRLASFIINAAEKAWYGDINGTQAFGGMGNTDIAVKMESVGEFTIKGIRVDADKVTKATFTVVKQAIQLAAAANGIVVPVSGAAGAPVAPDATLVSQISSAGREAAAAKAKVKAARQAAIMLFDTIVRQREAVAGNDNDARKKAIQTIKSTYDGMKGQLSPPAEQPAASSKSGGVSGGGGA